MIDLGPRREGLVKLLEQRRVFLARGDDKRVRERIALQSFEHVRQTIVGQLFECDVTRDELHARQIVLLAQARLHLRDVGVGGVER